MKNSTFLKGLFATSLACFCMSMPAWAQEEGGETTPTTVKVYQMTDHVTSGKSYAIGVSTDQGWYLASAPWGWGGLLLCQTKVEIDDNNQIRPTGYDLPVFLVTEEDKGYTLQAVEGTYIGAEKPTSSGDDKGDGKNTKDDGKDDGKGDVVTGVFLNNSTLTEDSYWDIAYDDGVEGFAIKNKATGMSVGLDVVTLPSIDENGNAVVSYDYRLAPFVDLTAEYKAPIYLFEMSEQVSGIEDMEYDQANAPKYVYNLSGMMVGKTTEGLNPGVYVVKQGKSVKKIVVD